MRVLDVGYNENEFSAYDNYIEKHYPYPEKLTALGLHPPRQFAARYPKVKVVRYDGTRFPFEDKAFDVCWSNAVLEHVGDRASQRRFICEIQRVAHAGFVTTPNRWFPVEIHTRIPFLHYLPKRVFDAVLRKTGKGWAAGDYMHLLSKRDIRRLLHDAGIESYQIVNNRFCGFVMDVVILLGDFVKEEKRAVEPPGDAEVMV